MAWTLVEYVSFWEGAGQPFVIAPNERLVLRRIRNFLPTTKLVVKDEEGNQIWALPPGGDSDLSPGISLDTATRPQFDPPGQDVYWTAELYRKV